MVFQQGKTTLPHPQFRDASAMSFGRVAVHEWTFKDMLTHVRVLASLDPKFFKEWEPSRRKGEERGSREGCVRSHALSSPTA